MRKWTYFWQRGVICLMEEVKEKMGELDSSGAGIGAEVRKKEEEVYKVGFCRMGLLFVKIDLQLNKMGSPSDKLDRRICKLNWQSCKMGW